MPGKTSFVAGFIQCEFHQFSSTRGLTRNNIPSQRRRYQSKYVCSSPPSDECIGSISAALVLSARVLVNLIMDNHASLSPQHAVAPPRIVTDGMSSYFVDLCWKAE